MCFSRAVVMYVKWPKAGRDSHCLNCFSLDIVCERRDVLNACRGVYCLLLCLFVVDVDAVFPSLHCTVLCTVDGGMFAAYKDGYCLSNCFFIGDVYAVFRGLHCSDSCFLLADLCLVHRDWPCLLIWLVFADLFTCWKVADIFRRALRAEVCTA